MSCQGWPNLAKRVLPDLGLLRPEVDQCRWISSKSMPQVGKLRHDIDIDQTSANFGQIWQRPKLGRVPSNSGKCCPRWTSSWHGADRVRSKSSAVCPRLAELDPRLTNSGRIIPNLAECWLKLAQNPNQFVQIWLSVGHNWHNLANRLPNQANYDRFGPNSA